MPTSGSVPEQNLHGDERYHFSEDDTTAVVAVMDGDGTFHDASSVQQCGSW